MPTIGVDDGRDDEANDHVCIRAMNKPRSMILVTFNMTVIAVVVAMVINVILIAVAIIIINMSLASLARRRRPRRSSNESICSARHSGST